MSLLLQFPKQPRPCKLFNLTLAIMTLRGLLSTLEGGATGPGEKLREESIGEVEQLGLGRSYIATRVELML